METPVVFEHLGDRLKAISEITNIMYDHLEKNIHKYVPGKRVSTSNPPRVGEIVLFLAIEAERKRNERFKYGMITETCVDGRLNRVRIKYRNSNEVVHRSTTRNVRDIVIIMNLEDLDFNTVDQQLINKANVMYLTTIRK